MRWIALSDTPMALATARPVQWVASPGGSEHVSASTLATVAVVRGALPGGRVLSRSSPSTPSKTKRACQRHTAGRLAPVRCATSSTVSRSAEARMILARCTCFTGRFRSAMIASSRAASSAFTSTHTVWAMAQTRTPRLPCESGV